MSLEPQNKVAGPEPSWIQQFRDANNKASYLRTYADDLYRRARAAQDIGVAAELLDGALAALGSAINFDRQIRRWEDAPSPYDALP